MKIWLKVAKMKIPLMAACKKGPETRVGAQCAPVPSPDTDTTVSINTANITQPETSHAQPRPASAHWALPPTRE